MNPSTSKVVSAQQTNLPSNKSTNNPQAYNPQGYNAFDRNAVHLQTTRFADVKPFYCSPEIEGNNARISTTHDLRTLTLKSPLLSEVRMDKSFFQVPWSSIAPRTWELLIKQPAKGDDINWSNVHQSISLKSLMRLVRSFIPNLFGAASYQNVDFENALPSYIFGVLACNTIIGNDTLIKSLGTSLPLEDEFDELKDRLVTMLFNQFNATNRDNQFIGSVGFVTSDNVRHYISEGSSLSDIYQWLDDLVFYASDIVSTSSDSVMPLSVNIYEFGESGRLTGGIFLNGTDQYTAEQVQERFPDIYEFIRYASNDLIPKIDRYLGVDESVSIDLMRCIAYQQVCVQYFSNSHVDDIYYAKKYNETVHSLIYNYDKLLTGNLRTPYYPMIMAMTSGYRNLIQTTMKSFELNGEFVDYDIYSKAFMDNLAVGLVRSIVDNGEFTIVGSQTKFANASLSFLCFVDDLFGIKRSLKYGDYFVSARTRPLAVGDVNVTVSNNNVSVIDTNKALWYQRLLNAVNRMSQNVYEYLRSMTGVSPERIPPQPNFICSESYRIGGMEVENTSNDQGNIVTLARSQESRYMYEAYIDEPSFIIGVVSFVAQNIYPQSSSRITFFDDRFDWFNHFLQHTGDQDVQYRELLVPNLVSRYVNTPISYQIRYAEFKTALSRATGAFSKGSLKSWAVIPEYKTVLDIDDNGILDDFSVVLSPYFIRNKNSDFDNLYASLTARNNADRFHFIISHYFNDTVNSRQASFPSLDA